MIIKEVKITSQFILFFLILFLLIECSIKTQEVSDNNIIDISFTNSYNAADISVISLKGQKLNDSIQFTIKTNSGVIRNYAFFNPPDGNLIKYIVLDGIPTGTNTEIFNIKINDLKTVSQITMKFYTTAEDVAVSNYIFLNYSDIQKLF